MKQLNIQSLAGHMGQALLHSSAPGKNQTAKKVLISLSRALIGLILSNATVFGWMSPFGLCYLSVAGTGRSGIFALLGVIAGYAALSFRGDGLRYAAAAILIYAVLYVFRGTQIIRKAFFMPIIAGICTACIGFVYLGERGAGTEGIILYITEIILVISASYFFFVASGREYSGSEAGKNAARRTTGTLIFVVTLLIALAGISLPGGASLGRLIAFIVILFAARSGGIGAGSAAGIAVGLSMDAAAMGTPFFSMAYGFSGLIAGVFSGRGRVVPVLGCAMAFSICTIWLGGSALRSAVLIEMALGSVIFILLPAKLFSRANRLIYSGKGSSGEKKIIKSARARLEQAAEAFRELYEAVMPGFERKSDEDVAVIFDRASERVCRKCALASLCWEKDVISTYTALNDAAKKILERGAVKAEDFPGYFSSRCIRFGSFISLVSEELNALMIRRQSGNRLLENRRMVCGQYSQISAILADVASEMSEEVFIDDEAEKRLVKQLREYETPLRASVYRFANGRCRVEIEGEDLSPLIKPMRKTVEIVSQCVGSGVCEPEQINSPAGDRLVFSETERITATIGVAAHKKDRETQSGDCGTYFKNSDGELYIILSDGMGTGAEAANESAGTVRLLEKLLRAGISPETSLKTLNSALQVKNRDKTFATVDLLRTNLYTGEAVLYKYGAANSYIKCGSRIKPIRCGAFPIGMGTAASEPDICKVKLDTGDWVVLTTDGVSDKNEDKWLISEISAYAGDSPREFAEALLEKGVETVGRTDDMTVITLRLH